MSLSKIIKVYGHRGTRGTRPENTLIGFQEASDIGCYGVELDLHMSADKIPVVFHDTVISGKLCRDGSKKKPRYSILVHELTAKELKQYDCGSNFQIAFPHQIRDVASPIITFEEFLQYHKNHIVNLELIVELKIPPYQVLHSPDRKTYLDTVVRLLTEFDLNTRSYIQTSDTKILKRLKKHYPEVKGSMVFHNQKNFAEIAEDLELAAASPYYRLLNRKEVERCQNQGIKVIPWTANQVSDWERCLETGVNGIITDYPKKLIEYLANQPSEKKMG